ncbi:NAD-dependent epimerase/dehydratase family protein [Nakamurella flavida]|uniref:NAD-dependent epimerase/dehydratase family protein n=1 Tax=Nakamurella flavida TaxID=363630 RepID=UPI0027D88A93|nr:NAD(P)-dependent oxidoreductase [Nakamurella flavida]
MLTGGAGFLGQLLQEALLAAGHRVVSVDVAANPGVHPRLSCIRGDIRDAGLLGDLAARHGFHTVFHVAALLAHAVSDRAELWSSNVDGTRVVARTARDHGIAQVVFTSSNCLWGTGLGRPVTEQDAPAPVEIYGRSKLAGERILLDEYAGDFRTVVLRCPTIVEAGRLGLLAILFEFVQEGRTVWTVGGGSNRYQFVAGGDLVAAFLAALDHPATAVFGIGSDDVPTLREAYAEVIAAAGSSSRVGSLPRRLAVPAMRVAHRLRLSPLGPYQYRMIAQDFVFDTTAIKRELGWRPTLTNAQMLVRAYRYFVDNAAEIRGRTGVSAHRRAADMGIIRVVKWLS